MTGDSFTTALSFAPPEVVAVARSLASREITRLRRAGKTGTGFVWWKKICVEFMVFVQNHRTRPFGIEQPQRIGHITAGTGGQIRCC